VSEASAPLLQVADFSVVYPDGHVAGFTGAVRQVEGLAHGLTVAVSQCHMS